MPLTNTDISCRLPVNYLSFSRREKEVPGSLLIDRPNRTALLTVIDMCFKVTIFRYNLKLRNLREGGLG